MYLRSFVAKIAKVAKYSFFGVICLPKRCGCVFFFTNIKAVCRWLDFLSLNPALCCRNCCVNQYFAPLFFVVFVLMAQFVLVRNNIKRKIRKERIMRLSTPVNNSNNTGKRRGCRSYETSWRVAQTGGTRQRVKSSWLFPRIWCSVLHGLHVYATRTAWNRSHRIRIEWISRSSLRISSSCNASNCARSPPTSGWPRCSEGTRRGSSGERRRSWRTRSKLTLTR